MRAWGYIVLSVGLSGPIWAGPVYPPLTGGAIKDCSAGAASADVCRLDLDPSLTEAETRLGQQKTVWWRDGDRFTVVARQSAAAVRLCCALSLPLARWPGTDLWTVTVRSPHLDEAIIDIRIVADDRFVFAMGSPPEWRGPKAPPPPMRADPLHGTLAIKYFRSDNLGEVRRIAIYYPPDFDPARRYPVVYAADGEQMTDFVRVADALMVAGKIPPLLLVGLHSGYSETFDRRAADYLIGYDTRNRYFVRHEDFFLNEVIPAVEGAFKTDGKDVDRFLIGKSNGAAWAVDTALRHPGLFSHAAGLSLCWWPPPDGKRDWRADGPKLFLAAGLFEPSCLKTTTLNGERARAAGADATVRTQASGHTPAMWNGLFADALIWAFGHGS